MQWSRHDEHGWDPKDPPTLIDLETALDDKGAVTVWHSQFFVPQGAASLVPLTSAELGELTFDRSMVTSLDRASDPIITFPDVPEVVTGLIDLSDEAAWDPGNPPPAAIVPPAL